MFGALAKRIFGSTDKSKSVARSRLHFVLVQDRTGLSNEDMAKFRGELVEVIKRYFIVDEQGFNIDYERTGETTSLVINSPVVVKRQEGMNGIAGAKSVGEIKSRGEDSPKIKSGKSKSSGSRRKRRSSRVSGSRSRKGVSVNS